MLGVGTGLPGPGGSVRTAHPTALPASLLSGSGCHHPQQPWQAARKASGGGGRWRGRLSPGAPCDGNCVNPGQPASRADRRRRQRQWLHCGCCWGGLGVAEATATPSSQGQMEAGWSGHAGLREAQRCTPGNGSLEGRDTLCVQESTHRPRGAGGPGREGVYPRGEGGLRAGLCGGAGGRGPRSSVSAGGEGRLLESA